MDAQQVQELVAAGIENVDVAVEGGGGKFQVRAVSPAFAGLSKVRKQQLVYGCLNEHIASGAIHAVEMQLFTPEEWAELQNSGS